ncbi:MAG: two-component sensor histidine kinase [Ferruginibacter sp.]|nr:two-component sensor histidine kinase [Ferruginibacter sp.]
MPAKQKKIQFAFIIYWVLLAYIISALIFWFIALNRQNSQMTAFKMERLVKDQPGFAAEEENIQQEKKRKTAQYIGEGSIFLLLIVAGAIFVFRSVRRQLKLSLQQQNFMIAITHELKTPIAVAKLNLETLQKRKLDEAQQQRLIYNTLQEANRLNSLCNNMLLSSQIEAGGYRLTNEELNFSDLVSSCVTDFSIRYPQRSLQEEITGEIFVTGDAFLLQIAINNLLENAIKYSAREKTIVVRLDKKSSDAVLQVQDEGPGIADEEKKKVFEKFYRLGNEATKRSKGTGLGLYLTHKIISTHEGTISITDNISGGSIFTVTLNAEA